MDSALLFLPALVPRRLAVLELRLRADTLQPANNVLVQTNIFQHDHPLPQADVVVSTTITEGMQSPLNQCLTIADVMMFMATLYGTCQGMHTLHGTAMYTDLTAGDVPVATGLVPRGVEAALPAAARAAAAAAWWNDSNPAHDPGQSPADMKLCGPWGSEPGRGNAGREAAIGPDMCEAAAAAAAAAMLMGCEGIMSGGMGGGIGMGRGIFGGEGPLGGSVAAGFS